MLSPELEKNSISPGCDAGAVNEHMIRSDPRWISMSNAPKGLQAEPALRWFIHCHFQPVSPRASFT